MICPPRAARLLAMTDRQSAPEPLPAEPDLIPEEELVPEDDAIIGRAFRWSAVVIVLIVAFVGLAVLWANRTEPVVEVVIEKDPGAIENLQPTIETLPDVSFKDITVEAGIDFVHTNGARGDKLLPETMGSGAAFFDYDGDGDQDLLLINSTHWPGVEYTGPLPTMALYRNDGQGAFSNVTIGSGLEVTAYGMGVAVGDYDNDGNVDVFITAVGFNHLYHNLGGYFQDVTAQAGVAGGETQWGSSASFFDYDNDGDLDLLVANYVHWSREIDFKLNFTLNGTDRAYGPPTNYRGEYPTLYRNNGDGTFTDVSAEAGMQIDNPATGLPVAKALAILPVDIDGDGFIDLVIANDTVPNFLFRNNTDGTFQEIGARGGIAFNSAGKATGAMGIDAGHYRNDRDLAISIGNFANEMTSLYVSQREALQFADQAIGEGIGSPTRLGLTFGLFFFDYDLDGRLDLLQANGHLEDEINTVQPSQHYRQPAQVFWNAGPQTRSCFVEVPTSQLGDLSMPIVGRGAAYADIDGDGDLDVLLTQAGGPPMLLRNEQDLGHHWLRVKLIGRTCNRDAIGAWVELTAAGVTQRRQVMPTRSYLSQVELPVTFGLGDATEVDSLRIIWPDQATQEVAVDQLDTMLVIEQPVG